MITPLSEIKCFLLDMDGTIYLGNQLIPGTLDFLSVLKERRVKHCFLTNNSSKDSSAYLEKLNKLGIHAESNQVMTSGEATAIYLKAINPGSRIFLLGTPELTREFNSHGFSLVGKEDEPDYVVLGFDTTLTYQKLWDACDLVRNGVKYVATHPDFICPLPGGNYMPDTGAIIAFIEAATGKQPKVIGKPNREIVDAVLTRTGCTPGDVAIVGDRLYTDVAMGHGAGITSVLVLSGETNREDIVSSTYKPDYVYDSIADLAAALNRRSNP